MEFPDLGEHCSHASCRQLDFLPVKCDACGGVYCSAHFQYARHSCPKAYVRDNQVPICPLCDQPVAVRRGEPPDIGVGQHIDRFCESESARRKRNAIYKNKCSVKNCKRKELMPLLCEKCALNYCLTHRHSADHNCVPSNKRDALVSKSGSAAIQRSKNNTLSTLTQNQFSSKAKAIPVMAANLSRTVHSIQGNYSEDEALARAMQQSMIDTHRHDTPNDASNGYKPNSHERDDAVLAQAIAESQRQANRTKDKCHIS